MNPVILPFLRCPLSGSVLELLSPQEAVDFADVREGVLLSQAGTAFPVIEGVPRLLPDAMEEHADFLRRHLPDFDVRFREVKKRFGKEISLASAKNRKTRRSFSLEWAGYDYESGKTWNLNALEMLEQFFRESGETAASVSGKKLLDAGCGNGQLSMSLAELGAEVFAMDFSAAVQEASGKNKAPNCHFLQADVEFPPFEKKSFDLVHSSGVLIHTRNTRLSFQKLIEFVSDGGKISIWVYRKRTELTHHFFNRLRRFTTFLPVGLQIPFLRIFIFWPAFFLKKWKGNPQTSAALWIEVLDWFTPEFRHEHHPEEVLAWFRDASCRDASISDENHWGFSAFGTRQLSEKE